VQIVIQNILQAFYRKTLQNYAKKSAAANFCSKQPEKCSDPGRHTLKIAADQPDTYPFL
jgi:hypothetical protein